MKWLIYFAVFAVISGLNLAGVPPFVSWDQKGILLCVVVILISALRLYPRPTFEESPKGSWIGYLKGTIIFLPMVVFFAFWFKLSPAESIGYITVALLVSIVLRRPQDDSWKSANYWAELPLVGFAVMYLVDQGIIRYFWS